MATNLFNQYYSDPKKQYVYTNMTCGNNSSADQTNFTISGDAAVISDGTNELASVDLSSISEYMTDWRNETRIIEPYQFIYFKGFSEGLAYQRNVFIKIPEYLTSDDDFEYVSRIEFCFKYYRNGCPFETIIIGKGNLTEYKSFIEDAQEQIDENKIPATISMEDGAIIITSTVLGYDFYIASDMHTNSIKLVYDIVYQSDNNKSILYLYDCKEGFVPPKKYRNGAFRGILLKPTYPVFNANGIQAEQKALQLAHIKNRIEIDTPVRVGCMKFYDKTIKDVIDSYNDVAEMEKYEKWRCADSEVHCGCSGWDEWDDGEVEEPQADMRNITGLYGFINWVQRNNAWNRFGALYAVVAPKDTVDTDTYNLIDSFVVYNPNSFPIQISCMLMS